MNTEKIDLEVVVDDWKVIPVTVPKEWAYVATGDEYDCTEEEWLNWENTVKKIANAAGVWEGEDLYVRLPKKKKEENESLSSE